MSIDVDKSPEESISLSEWWFSIFISAACLLISLINIPAVHPALVASQAPVFTVVLGILMLFRRKEIKILPFFFAVLIYDIVHGFASFYLIVLVLFWVGLKISRRKQFVWRFSYGYVAFAHMVAVVEFFRFIMISFFLDRGFSLEVFALSVALQILYFPIVYIAIVGKDQSR